MSFSFPAEGTEFEKLRRSHENRNERIINVIRAGGLLAVFVGNGLTRVVGWTLWQAPTELLVLFGALLLTSVGVEFYLRHEAEYHPMRKYVMCTGEVGFTALGFLLAEKSVPALYLVFAPPVIYAILIVLAGLRYSTTAVFVTGILSLCAHASYLSLRSDSEFRGAGIVVHIVAMALITAGVSYNVASIISIHRQASLQEQLKRFLPPELVALVARDPSILNRKTERCTATVLFTDVRGFTRLSEQLSPEVVVEFLNRFLDEMTQSIMLHGGMLDKYVGDAAMAVFGVLQGAQNHADRALQTAMDMQQRLIRLNDQFLGDGLPQLGIGIGLHTGELLAGTIGSLQRLEYTVIGDTVNVASRVESMTRNYPVQILLSEETRVAAGNSIPLYEIDSVTLKNRTKPVRLWSPDRQA
jgi:class 3 adenylate cyclase